MELSQKVFGERSVRCALKAKYGANKLGTCVCLEKYHEVEKHKSIQNACGPQQPRKVGTQEVLTKPWRMWDKIQREWSGEEEWSSKGRRWQGEKDKDYVTYALDYVIQPIAHRPRIGEEIRAHKKRRIRRKLGPPDDSLCTTPQRTTVLMCGYISEVEKWINGHYAVGCQVRRKN